MAEPPGATKYLSEVVAGDVVLAVDATDGRSRGVVVGRAKTEPRPMLRVDFALTDDGGSEGQLFLQQAETVRLAALDTEGGALPVTMAASASSAGKTLPQVFVRASARGTHVGKTIQARVSER